MVTISIQVKNISIPHLPPHKPLTSLVFEIRMERAVVFTMIINHVISEQQEFVFMIKSLVANFLDLSDFFYTSYCFHIESFKNENWISF